MVFRPKRPETKSAITASTSALPPKKESHTESHLNVSSLQSHPPVKETTSFSPLDESKGHKAAPTVTRIEAMYLVSYPERKPPRWIVNDMSYATLEASVCPVAESLVITSAQLLLRSTHPICSFEFRMLAFSLNVVLASAITLYLWMYERCLEVAWTRLDRAGHE